MRLLLGLVAVIAAAACSKSQPASPTTLPRAPDLAMTAGVDPRDPGRVLPVAPVVAPIRLPSLTRAGKTVTTVFQARADASCQMQIVYSAGGKQDNLPPKVTNDDGFVSWTWVPVHRGTVTTRVVCSGGQVGQATINVL